MLLLASSSEVLHRHNLPSTQYCKLNFEAYFKPAVFKLLLQNDTSVYCSSDAPIRDFADIPMTKFLLADTNNQFDKKLLENSAKTSCHETYLIIQFSNIQCIKAKKTI